jgi:hypothetical protein
MGVRVACAGEEGAGFIGMARVAVAGGGGALPWREGRWFGQWCRRGHTGAEEEPTEL